MKREIGFFNSECIINAYEKKYWTTNILKNIKIGVEIEANADSNLTYDLRREFKPTNDTSNFGEFGVYKVDDDGSLHGGAEVCTVGRRINFFDMYHQYKYICEKMLQFGAYINARCGLHNHILYDYNTNYNSLEQPMPSIIFKNFIQLFKRHYPEIVWMFSSIDESWTAPYDIDSLNIRDDETYRCFTRNPKFCKHNTLFSNTINKQLKQFCKDISGGERYKAINLRYLTTKEDQETIDHMHIEIRTADGSLYPAHIATMNAVYVAMFLKAVKLSEIGLISTAPDWERTKQLTEAIRNEMVWDSDDRFSKPASDTEIEEIKDRGREFIKFISPELSLIDSKVIPFAMSLNEEPVSFMLRKMSTKEVNDFFQKFIESQYVDKTDKDILKFIATVSLDSCMSEYDWCDKVGKKLNKPTREIQSSLNAMRNIRNLEFDAINGTVIEK